MPDASPFHVGERQVQERLGVRAVESWARKGVRDHLPEQHRAFHTALPFLVAAARDDRGRPWATLLVGGEGFITSPDSRTLAIDAPGRRRATRWKGRSPPAPISACWASSSRRGGATG